MQKNISIAYNLKKLELSDGTKTEMFVTRRHMMSTADAFSNVRVSFSLLSLYIPSARAIFTPGGPVQTVFSLDVPRRATRQKRHISKMLV